MGPSALDMGPSALDMGPSALLFPGAYNAVKMALFTTTIVNVQVTFKVNYENKKNV
jgi:hypothetical protein